MNNSESDRLDKSAGFAPRFFVGAFAEPLASIDCDAHGACDRKHEMALDRTNMICRRVVIDDRCRLPGRFFGRFATSATSELTRAA